LRHRLEIAREALESYTEEIPWFDPRMAARRALAEMDKEGEK
jgi:hypothetical protein